MTDFKANLQGIIAMCAAMAGIILNDACVKTVSESGLPTGEIIFVRGLIAFSFITVLALRFGLRSDFPRLFDRRIGWRTLGEVAGTAFYLTALFQMAIGPVTAILQALPLMITAGAAIFLREKVGLHRWAAVLVGFAGVLIIMRPGLEGFDATGLLVVISMLFIALRDLVTRTLPAIVSSYSITWCAALGVCLLGFAMLPLEDWTMPTGYQFGMMVVASIFLLIGYFGSIAAMRIGEISAVSPFRYTIVVWALLLGYFIWGEVPDLPTLIGTAIIVAMGVYTVFRERRTARRAMRAVSHPAAPGPISE